MRQGGPNNRNRPRGRHHGGPGNGGGNGGGNGNPMGSGKPRSAASLRHQNFDSNGPDVRVRGNAWQVCEKYQSLARDATSAGDRIAAENFLQHAEHYYRITQAINEATAAELRQRGGPAPGINQQPDMPSNYYGADGNGIAQPVQSPMASHEAQPMSPHVQAQVQVETRSPNPFFMPEENDEIDSGLEPLLASR